MDACDSAKVEDEKKGDNGDEFGDTDCFKFKPRQEEAYYTIKKTFVELNRQGGTGDGHAKQPGSSPPFLATGGSATLRRPPPRR